MKSFISGPVIINAVLFQITWFACVLGGANGQTWPAIIACLALATWQLQAKRRHPSDAYLIVVAIVLGLAFDSFWIHADFMAFKTQWPFTTIAPAWIIVLWIGFSLTINHSLSWLSLHPLLPAVMGLIGGPLSYSAGLRLGAVDYLDNPLLISACLGVTWALSMVILVYVSRLTTEKLKAAENDAVEHQESAAA